MLKWLITTQSTQNGASRVPNDPLRYIKSVRYTRNGIILNQMRHLYSPQPCCLNFGEGDEYLSHYFNNRADDRRRCKFIFNQNNKREHDIIRFNRGSPRYVKNMAPGPQSWEKPRPTASVLVNLSSSGNVFNT